MRKFVGARVTAVIIGGGIAIVACGGSRTPAEACESAFQSNYPTASSFLKADPDSADTFPGEPKSLSAACNTLTPAQQTAVTNWARKYYSQHP